MSSLTPLCFSKVEWELECGEAFSPHYFSCFFSKYSAD